LKSIASFTGSGFLEFNLACLDLLAIDAWGNDL
jgi:hypothetical protein